MRNEIRGEDSLRQSLWYAREVGEGREEWEGTGIDYPGFILHTNFKAALTWYLTTYPKTDTIHGVFDGHYRLAYPHTAAAITIIDAIAKELGL